MMAPNYRTYMYFAVYTENDELTALLMAIQQSISIMNNDNNDLFS